jgi:hypothetical protein
MRDPTVNVAIAKITEAVREFLGDRNAFAWVTVADMLHRAMEEQSRSIREQSALITSLIQNIQEQSALITSLTQCLEAEDYDEMLSLAAKGLGKRLPRERGRSPKWPHRDIQIAVAVGFIVASTTLAPTRSHAQRQRREPSACNIVCTALEQLGEHKSERTIEGIWHRYKDGFGPTELARVRRNP